jgi:hypothetical protein
MRRKFLLDNLKEGDNAEDLGVDDRMLDVS